MFISLFLTLFLITNSLQSPHVILITIDGVRWQEIFNGSEAGRDLGNRQTPRQLVPNLYNSFVDQGIAIGKDSPIYASGPNHISLPGYLEITRGHSSIDCQDNNCNPIIDQSIFWFFNHSAIFSSWPNIVKTIPKSKLIYSDTPKVYRSDNMTELSAISYLDNNSPDFLWVSLCDTDKNAHYNNYSKYLESLTNADYFIGYLVNRFPYSNIIVTTDHGRANTFSDHGLDKTSKRVWLMMRGPNIPNKSFIKTTDLSLSNIFPTIIDLEFNFKSKNSILNFK